VRLDKKFLAKFLGIDESEIISITGREFVLSKVVESKTFQGLVLERFKRKFQALMAAVVDQDTLGAVLKGHIHIEHELEEVLTFAASAPVHLKISSMEFSEKVQLALVLGLNDKLKSPLNALGKLRNKFAHTLDFTLGEEEINNLVATLPPLAKQGFQNHLRTMSLPEAQSLSGKARSFFKVRTQLIAFLGQLFDEVTKERHRMIMEKLERMAWQ
jgi:hypothetical protein